MTIRTIAAGQFKQHCLALLDEVNASGQDIVVTKRGRPVARLCALAGANEREATVLARLRGAGRTCVPEAELLTPLDTGWDLQPDVPT